MANRPSRRALLNNAATLIEEDKAAFTKSRGEAVTIIPNDLVPLLD